MPFTATVECAITGSLKTLPAEVQIFETETDAARAMYEGEKRGRWTYFHGVPDSIDAPSYLRKVPVQIRVKVPFNHCLLRCVAEE